MNDIIFMNDISDSKKISRMTLSKIIKEIGFSKHMAKRNLSSKRERYFTISETLLINAAIDKRVGSIQPSKKSANIYKSYQRILDY